MKNLYFSIRLLKEEDEIKKLKETKLLELLHKRKIYDKEVKEKHYPEISKTKKIEIENKNSKTCKGTFKFLKKRIKNLKGELISCDEREEENPEVKILSPKTVGNNYLSFMKDQGKKHRKREELKSPKFDDVNNTSNNNNNNNSQIINLKKNYLKEIRLKVKFIIMLD